MLYPNSMKTTSLALIAVPMLFALPVLPAAAAPLAPDVFDKCTSNVNSIRSAYYARSCASSSAIGDGPQGSAPVSSAAIGNGYDSAFNAAFSGARISTSYTKGGWANASETVSNTNAIARTSSDLTDASLHASVETAVGGRNTAGFANARFGDTVNFFNTSGGLVILPITVALDGNFLGPVRGSDGLGGPGSATLSLSIGNIIGKTATTHANSGRGLGDLVTLRFWSDGRTDLVDLGGPLSNNADYTFDYSNTGGIAEGYFSTLLAIPAGESSLGLTLTLEMNCGARGTVCDFGNTGTFRFGNLPDGLTFSSESGVFLSAVGQNPPPPTDVPEPASIAVLGLGLVLAGRMLLRR